MTKDKRLLLGFFVGFLVFNLCTGMAFAEQTTVAKVNATGVNLRSGPGQTYQTKGTLTLGHKLNILEKKGLWYKVKTPKGNIGWVKKQYISLSRSEVSRGGTRTAAVPKSVVEYARQYLGVNYSWGGSSPEGFDCSGFVSYVFQNFGIQLSHNAESQSRECTSVSKTELRAGDLVFFDTNGGHNYINHVGIYIGSGQFIHASSGRGQVTISSLNEDFYAGSYMTSGRILNPN